MEMLAVLEALNEDRPEKDNFSFLIFFPSEFNVCERTTLRSQVAEILFSTDTSWAK